ncbi:hypothetical protein JCM10213_008965 [Rhodosporidiobolus nylandii]
MTAPAADTTFPLLTAPPVVVWTETRTRYNMPPYLPSLDGGPAEAQTCGLDRIALEKARRVLKVGTFEEWTESPYGKMKIEPGDRQILDDLKDGTAVFLVPLSRVTAAETPSIIPTEMQEKVRKLCEEGRTARWTHELEDVYKRFSGSAWTALAAHHWLEQLSNAEWSRRFYTHSGPMCEESCWAREEREACNLRVEKQKTEFMNLYDIYWNTLPHELPAEKDSATLDSEEYLFVQPRDKVDLLRFKHVGIAALTNAKWVIRLSRVIPADVHVPQLKTGESTFLVPDSRKPEEGGEPQSRHSWPKLLDPALSSRIVIALQTGADGFVWKESHQALLDSVEESEWESLVTEAWADWLEMQHWNARYEHGSWDAWSEGKTARNRYRQRREECLALYELRHLLASKGGPLVAEEDDFDKEEPPKPASFLSTLASWAKSKPELFAPVVPPPCLPLI